MSTHKITKNAVNVALKALGIAGLAGVTVIAPNALQALDLILKKNRVSLPAPDRALAEMKRQGLVHITQDGENWHYTLTPAGIHRLQDVMIDELTIPSPDKWDKKWRMVAFDIPTRNSRPRAYFTTQLKELGFVMLQKSLWIHPFPSFELVEQIAGHYNVLRYCTMIEVERLDELATKRLLRQFDQLLS